MSHVCEGKGEGGQATKVVVPEWGLATKVQVVMPEWGLATKVVMPEWGV